MDSQEALLQARVELMGNAMLPEKPKGWIERGASGPAIVRPAAYPPRRREIPIGEIRGQATQHTPTTKPMSMKEAERWLEAVAAANS